MRSTISINLVKEIDGEAYRAVGDSEITLLKLKGEVVFDKTVQDPKKNHIFVNYYIKK